MEIFETKMFNGRDHKKSGAWRVLVFVFCWVIIFALDAKLSGARADCAKIPNLKIWEAKTSVKVKEIVATQYNDDWEAYLDKLEDEHQNSRAIYSSGGTYQTGNSDRIINLSGPDLAYYNWVQSKRLTAVKCLAAEAMGEELEQLTTAAPASSSNYK